MYQQDGTVNFTCCSLGDYSTQNNIPQLTAHQFDLIDKTVTVLTPTENISSETSSIFVVIPFIRALRKHLENNDDND